MKPNYKFISSVLALSIIAFWVVAASPDTQRVIVTTTAATRAWLDGTGSLSVTNSNPGVNINGSAGTATLGFRTASGGTDSKQWDVIANPTLFEFRSVNDAYTTSFAWLKATRADPNTNPPYITGITLGTNTTINGSLVVTNGILTTTNSYFGSATLVAGTNLVTGSACTNNAIIFLSRQLTNGTLGYLSYAITNGSNFNIRSSSSTDTSVVHWMIVKTQ